MKNKKIIITGAADFKESDHAEEGDGVRALVLSTSSAVDPPYLNSFLQKN